MKWNILLVWEHRLTIIALTVMSWLVGSVLCSDFLSFARYSVFCLFAIPAAVLDWHYGRLYNKLVFCMLLAGVMADLLCSLVGGLDLGSFLAGALVYGAVLLVIRWLSKGGLGHGDIKYGVANGIWLGLSKAIIGFYCSFILGASFVFMYVIYCKASKRRLSRRIAFGPFMTIGSIVGLLWGDTLWEMYGNLCRIVDGATLRL